MVGVGDKLALCHYLVSQSESLYYISALLPIPLVNHTKKKTVTLGYKTIEREDAC